MQPWPALDVLEPYMTTERLQRIDGVLRHRLASVSVVLEDVFDPHNVAACVRTAEGMGLQDVHWMLNQHDVRMSSTVAKSADQWLDFHQHRGTAAGVQALQAQGFQVWVSDLQATQTLDALPLPAKLAIVVGNAKRGITDEMRAAADQHYILPMHGMVQSFNLSVALAMTLGIVVPRRRAELAALGETGDLPMARMWPLRRKWIDYSMERAQLMRQQLGDKP